MRQFCVLRGFILFGFKFCEKVDTRSFLYPRALSAAWASARFGLHAVSYPRFRFLRSFVFTLLLLPLCESNFKRREKITAYVKKKYIEKEFVKSAIAIVLAQ